MRVTLSSKSVDMLFPNKALEVICKPGLWLLKTAKKVEAESPTLISKCINPGGNIIVSPTPRVLKYTTFDEEMKPTVIFPTVARTNSLSLG